MLKRYCDVDGDIFFKSILHKKIKWKKENWENNRVRYLLCFKKFDLLLVSFDCPKESRRINYDRLYYLETWKYSSKKSWDISDYTDINS